MREDFYATQTQDYEIIQGDTLNMAFTFKDKDGNPIDDIVNQNWTCRFTLEDPITDELITGLIKTHDDTPPSGDGIYFNGDANTIPGLGITRNNQIVIIADSDDTLTLKDGVYRLFVKFEIDQAYHAEWTAVKGNLIVKRRDT